MGCPNKVVEPSPLVYDNHPAPGWPCARDRLAWLCPFVLLRLLTMLRATSRSRGETAHTCQEFARVGVSAAGASASHTNGRCCLRTEPSPFPAVVAATDAREATPSCCVTTIISRSTDTTRPDRAPRGRTERSRRACVALRVAHGAIQAHNPARSSSEPSHVTTGTGCVDRAGRTVPTKARSPRDDPAVASRPERADLAVASRPERADAYRPDAIGGTLGAAARGHDGPPAPSHSAHVAKSLADMSPRCLVMCAIRSDRSPQGERAPNRARYVPQSGGDD